MKCPSCKGKTLTLYERLEVAHAHYIEDGNVYPVEIADGLPSNIGYSAVCKCGHVWVPKRATASKIIDRDVAST